MNAQQVIMGRYDDIINLPHHISRTRIPMPPANRAAQFAPFAALTGHDEAISETARLTSPIKKIDECAGCIVFTDKRNIPLACIYSIDGNIFNDFED